MQSPKNYLIAFLALTTVAGGALAWHQYQELIGLRAAALAQGAERAEWQKKLWAAEKQRAALETRLAGAASAKSAESEAGLPEELPPVPRGNRGGRPNFLAIMDQPEMQRLVALQQKAGLDGHYGNLFRTLNLSPEQLDKFKNLLVEKRTAMMDVMAAAREQGVNPRTDPAAFRALVENAENDIDASIRSTLGDAGFAQYQSYEKTLPQREVVGQLQSRLSYSSTPLTPTQQEQMVQILAATSPSRNNNGIPVPLTPFGGAMRGSRGAPTITDATINQSLGVLAAPQVDALKQLQQEQQAQAALNTAIREQFRNNPPPAQPAPNTPAAATTGAPPPGGG